MLMTDAATTADAMLAAATRLFTEFDELPVMTVLREIGAARVLLRDVGLDVTADSVEEIARAQLRQRLAAA